MNSIYLTQAVNNCEQALDSEQSQPERWQQSFRELGNVLQGIGRFDEAIVWHSLALETNPNFVEV